MRYLLAIVAAFCLSLAHAEDVPATAPVISAPTGSGNGVTPEFAWSAVDGATHYDLWVDDLTTGTSQILREQNISGTAFTPAVALADNHSFKAWVRAGNGAGFGPWSAEKIFATGTGPVSAPTGTPAISTPAGSGNGATPEFAWTAVANATVYDLWVDDLTAGTSQVLRNQNINGTTFTPAAALPDNHSFKAWVRAGNAFGFGPWSAEKVFATGTGPVSAPTGTPAVTAPAGTGNITTPEFAWSAVANATVYDLWVDDLTTGTSQILRNQSISGTAFTPAVALADNHSFKAWVRAGNAFGFGPWSAAQVFATGTAPISAPTGTPAVTTPTGSGNGTTPEFAWTAVANATVYDLWVDDLTAGTSQILRNQSVSGTTFTPAIALPDNHSFKAWVRAGNAFGFGPWSAEKVFATGTGPIAPPTQVPALSAPGNYTAQARPEVAWSAAENATFYDLWIDDLTTSMSQVIRETQVAAAQFTPAADLADGHRYRIWVRAGNVFGYGGWSAQRDFTIDSTPPAIHNLTVSPKPRTNVRRPTFAAGITVPANGIDWENSTVTLNGMDVKAQATLVGSGFSFTPAADLNEGDHTLSLTVRSFSGLDASSNVAVTTDYTPPALPSGTLISRTQTQVTYSGGTEPDVAEILAEVSGASADAGVQGGWNATVTNTGSHAFTLGVRLQDSADNVSELAVFQGHFSTDEALEPLAIVSFDAVNPVMIEDEIYIFDQAAVEFTAVVSGGTAPRSVFIAGKDAGSSSPHTVTLNLPEGETEVEVVARDAQGGMISKKIKVAVDTKAPVVEIVSPAEKTTAGLGFLYVNGLDEEGAAAVRNDPTLPRSVYARDFFNIIGTSRDAATDVAALAYEVREVDAVNTGLTVITNDLTFPFLQYAEYHAANMEVLLQQEPIATEASLQTGQDPTTASRHAALFLVENATTNLLDSYRVNFSEGGYNKIYLLTITTEDQLGHKAKSHLWVKVDTKAPIIADLVNSRYGLRDLFSNPTLNTINGPLRGIGTGNEPTEFTNPAPMSFAAAAKSGSAKSTLAGGVGGGGGDEGNEFPINPAGVNTDDTIRVIENGVPLKRSRSYGPWLFPSAHVLPLSASLGYEGEVEIEDIAGNKVVRAFNAIHQDFPAYTTFLTGSNGGSTSSVTTPVFPEGDPYPGGLSHETVESVNGNVTMHVYLAGDQLVETGPTVDPETEVVLSRVETERASFSGVTLDGKTYAAYPPNWSSSRTYQYSISGSFPYHSLSVGTVVSKVPELASSGTFQWWYDREAENKSTVVLPAPGSLSGTTEDHQTFSLFDPFLAYPTQSESGPFEGTGTLNPRDTIQFSPGLTMASALVSSSLTAETLEELSVGPRTFVIPPSPEHPEDPDTILNVEGIVVTGASASGQTTTVINKPRAFTVFQVVPDTLTAGKAQKVQIRGYFGDAFGAGAALPVSFTATSGSGTVAVVGNGATNSTGTLVYEDPFDTTVFQTLEVDVRPAADAEGKFTITVDGDISYTLDEVIQVVKFDLIADANHDTIIDAADFPEKEAKHGILMTSGFGLTGHPQTRQRVPIKLDFSAFDTTWENGTVKLLTDNPNVRVFTEATEGFELASEGDRIWFPPFGAPPEYVYLQFDADGEAGLRLEFERTDTPVLKLTRDLRIARLSHGLGGPDGMAPHAAVVPGYVSVNLTRGNLFVGAAGRSYHTPVMGPDITVYYNHMDGLPTGLGRGWRTNYDMRVLDGSSDRDGDGKVTMADRQQGDLLVLVGSTGRRFVFTFNASTQLFTAKPESGLLATSVDPDPAHFDAAGSFGYEYKLTGTTNQLQFFNAAGDLVRIEDLGGRGISVARDANHFAVDAIDDFGRGEHLLLPAGGDGITVLTGLQCPGLSFEYENGPGLTRRISRVALDGNFTHGGAVAYALQYQEGSNRLSHATLLNTGADSFQKLFAYTNAADPAFATGATVQELLGGTSTYTVDPAADAWTSMTDVVGIETARTVDPAMRRVTATATGSRTRTIGYDSKGNVASDEASGGPSLVYTYTDLGDSEVNLLESVTLAGVGSTTYSYYAGGLERGQVNTVTNAKGETTQYTYDANGFLATTTDGRNKVWTVTQVNAFGQPLQTLSPMNRTMAYAYGPTGLVASQTDIFGFTSHYGYDSRDRLVQTVQPNGAQTETVLDPLGRVVASTDELDRTTENTYDSVGRLTRTKHPGIADLTMSYVRQADRYAVTSQRAGRTLGSSEIDFAGRTLKSFVPCVLENGQPAVQCVTEYSYSAAEGWLDSAKDPRGHITSYERDDAGRVTKTHLPEGGVWETVYDATGRVTASKDPEGRTSGTTYDELSRVVLSTNPKGGTVASAYDAGGNVLSITPSLGNGESYTYDDDGVTVTHTDRLGRTHTVALDAAAKRYTVQTDNNPNRTATYIMNATSGFVSQVQTPEGTTSIAHRLDGVVSTVTAPGRGAAGRTFNALDQVVSTFDAAGGSSVSYDGVHGEATGGTNPLGLNITHQRDAATGDVLSSSDDVTGAPATVATIQKRDENGNVLEFLDAAGRLWTQEYDGDNRRTRAVDPTGIETTWSYTLAGLAQTVTVAGETVTFEYDSLGQRTKATDASGRATLNTYDAFGLLLQSQTGSQTTLYLYNPQTRLATGVVAPGGKTTTYVRDDYGRVTAVIDPNNNRTGYDYDDRDRVTRVEHPDLAEETYTYQSNGDLKDHTDRAGRTTRHTFDAAGRVATREFLDTQQTVTYGYNAANMLTSESMGGGGVSRSYDKRGRLVTLTHDGATTTFTYSNDDLLLTRNVDGIEESYAYDAFGRLTGLTAAGGSAGFTYDTKNRVQTIALPNNVSRSFSYQNGGRLAGMTQTVSGTPEAYSYAYDSSGRLVGLNGPDYSVSFTYDATGHLASEYRAGFGGYRNDYCYDDNGNRDSMTSIAAENVATVAEDFGGGTLPPFITAQSGSWAVINGALEVAGAAGLASAVLAPANDAFAHYTVKVDPRAATLAVGEARQAGFTLGADAEGHYSLGLYIRKALDGGNEVLLRRLRLLWVPAATGEPELVAQTAESLYLGGALTLDVRHACRSYVARIVEDDETIPELAAEAAHGALGATGLEVRAEGSAAATCAFDDLAWETASGAAQQKAYAYNALNQLTAITGSETANFTYDPAGRLIEQVKNGVTSTYAYDRLNRLTGMNVGGVQHSYGYSGPAWMRTSATVNGVTTSYAYDGFACIKETTNGVAKHYANFGGRPLWEAVPDAQQQLQPLTYAQDGRGNITGLVDAAGYASKFVYDGFGNLKTLIRDTQNPGQYVSGANSSGPRFGGQLYDAGTDQLYLRNRYYSPGTGRFNTMDPIGYEGGMNLYNYCNADPVNSWDPMGLDPISDFFKAVIEEPVLWLDRTLIKPAATNLVEKPVKQAIGPVLEATARAIQQPVLAAEQTVVRPLSQFIARNEDYIEGGALAVGGTATVLFTAPVILPLAPEALLAAGFSKGSVSALGVVSKYLALFQGVHSTTEGAVMMYTGEDIKTGLPLTHKEKAFNATNTTFGLLSFGLLGADKARSAWAEWSVSRPRLDLSVRSLTREEVARMFEPQFVGGTSSGAERNFVPSRVLFNEPDMNLSPAVAVGSKFIPDKGFVSLVSSERAKHILIGDITGGGHLWPGFPGKTPFPQGWSPQKILHVISDIATDPKGIPVYQRGAPGSLFTKKGLPSRYVVVLKREGVKIKVVVEPAGEGIITAHPE